MVTSKKLSGTAALIFFIYCTIALSQNARDPKGARPYRSMRMRAVIRRNEAHERSGGGRGIGIVDRQKHYERARRNGACRKRSGKGMYDRTRRAGSGKRNVNARQSPLKIKARFWRFFYLILK